MAVSLAYAIDKGTKQLVHIDKVPNGRACNCKCPSCGKDLVAKNNGKKQAHCFAHYKADECSWGLETSLHLLAKDVLSHMKELRVPKEEVYTHYGDHYTWHEKAIPIDEVFIEKTDGNVRPDLIVVSNGFRLHIEIYVTHKIDEVKLEKLRDMHQSALEIDLSDIENQPTAAELETILGRDVSRKRWMPHYPSEDWKIKREKETREKFKRDMVGSIQRYGVYDSVSLSVRLNYQLTKFRRGDEFFECPKAKSAKYCIDRKNDVWIGIASLTTCKSCENFINVGALGWHSRHVYCRIDKSYRVDSNGVILEEINRREEE